MEDVKKLTDQDLLFEEHDTLVDITHDTSGSLVLHNYYKALMDEIKERNLTVLPRLNGTISW